MRASVIKRLVSISILNYLELSNAFIVYFKINFSSLGFASNGNCFCRCEFDSRPLLKDARALRDTKRESIRKEIKGERKEGGTEM